MPNAQGKAGNPKGGADGKQGPAKSDGSGTGRDNSGGGGGAATRGVNPPASPPAAAPPVKGPNVANPFSDAPGNPFAGIGSGFGNELGTQGPAAPGQKPSRAGMPPESILSQIGGLLSPVKVFGNPVVDGIFQAALPTPIMAGLLVTKAIQAITGEMGVDANQDGETAGGGGGGNTNGQRAGATDNLQQTAQPAAQAAPAETGTDQLAPTVNTEIGRLLQEQRRRASQSAGGGVATTSQGLGEGARTAANTLFGA